jgi:hypothetical protein
VRPESKYQSILKTLRPFMGFALLTGGLVAISPAAEAEGVAAGTDISNTATASYEDPNDPNKPIETISNTVAVKVAKVAGIDIVSNGYTDVNSGKLVAGDTVEFNYKLVNVGNAAVQFSVPGAATVSNNADFQKVQYKDASGNWQDIANGTAVVIPGAVPVDGFVEVRVVVKVKTGTTAGNLEVSLGKTSTVNTTNAQRGAAPETDDSQDVFTVDITNSTDPNIPQGNAVNGVREASRQQIAPINAESQSFVNITMTGGTPTPIDPANPTPSTNKITYDISVKVDPNAPTGSDKAPADLGPTPIKLDTDGDPTTSDITTVNRVVISNPVPTNVDPSKLTAPTGWTPVYSTSPVGTPPDQIVWIPVPPSGVLPTPDQINFVGFINDGTNLPKSSTPYTGFQVEVVTTGIGPNGGTVNNTATVYGSTPNDPNKVVISDTTGTNAVNDPTNPTPIVTLITAPGNIFNGPNQKPQAVGPGVTGNSNNDYTNKSVQIAATDLTGTVNPATGLPDLARPVNASFNNTLENKGTAAADIYLLPTAPAVVGSLPNGTLVKITYGSESITYTYDGNGNYTADSTTKLPVKVTVGANAVDTYGVQVTLPSGTKQLTGYDAPITAFTGAVPTAGQVTVPTTGVTTNITIDRVYTGYLKLTKETRILQEDANGVKAPVAGTDGTFSPAAKTAAPRQFIEYRVKYENVSIGGGTDNVELKASKVKIEEDGVTAPNTWGNTTTHDKNSAANLVDGSVAGSIIFSPAGKDNTNTDVTGYRVELGTTNQVAPGKAGQFSFIRKVK